MAKQMKTLLKLELCNIYGRNVFRHTRDKKARRRSISLMAVGSILIAVLFFYMGGLSYGLIQLGLSSVIPAYLIAISSVLIFFACTLKAGSVIFDQKGYDTLCALPVSQTALVVSRFFRMYVENLLAALAVLLPGLAVYAWFVRPGWSFYLLGSIGALLVPLVPMAAAVLIGALVTGISSKMKNKNLVAAGLCILAVLVVLFAASQFSILQGKMSPDVLRELSAAVLSVLEKTYPPAVWFGSAVTGGDFLRWLACAALSLVAAAAVILVVSIRFHAICRRLFATSAKHNYRLKELEKKSIWISLCKREFKRYAASSVYVTNTIMGPVMGVVLSGALLFVDIDSIVGELPVQIDMGGFVPFALGGIFCMMTASAVSVSMEGKYWWIVKSLPLSTKSILDAKIGMNLILILPFYLVSEVLLIVALRPEIPELIWLLLLPAEIILFSCVYGITINLHFPVLNWESEVSVVKQSASSILGGMGGFVVGIVCGAGAAFLPGNYSVLYKVIICVLVLGATVFLYRKNNSMDLQEL